MTSHLTRRTLMSGFAAAGLGSAALGAGAARSPALAQTPEASALPAPGVGFYRGAVGDIGVTVLGDGLLGLGPVAGSVPQADPVAVEALLAENGLPVGDLTTAMNVVLLEIGDRRILLDAGSGPGFQPTAGRLLASLAGVGVAPDSIDTVVLTHAHPDHAWGLVDMASGAPVFANADYVIGEVEHAFWTAPATRDALPVDFRFLVDGATSVLSAIEARTTRVADGAEVAPGVSMMATPGHTPGHMSVALSSGDARLLVSGDVAAHPVISLARPDWAFVFDVDPEAASTTRKRILDMAATDGWPLLAYHFPFPGTGRVVRAGDGYRLVTVRL